MKIQFVFTALFLMVAFSFCNTPTPSNPTVEKVVEKPAIVRVKPSMEISYHFEKGKQWAALHTSDNLQQQIVRAVNRADMKYLKNMDSIVVPNDSIADISFFLPFPVNVPAIKNIDKIIFFSYPTQAFGAYENGELVYTGATNMGRKKDTTPTGLFHTNWKAEETTSTFNDEWELKWNFNIENKLGVGWHQYEMPGYPASHSCLRMQEADAKYLYAWADQWIEKKDTIEVKGTPVIVFGAYNFKEPKPWLKLVDNPHALDISTEQIEAVMNPYLNEIIADQEKRRAVGKSKIKS